METPAKNKSLTTFLVPNTASQRRMGAMPAAGEWVRLEIPTALIEVTDVYGMRFQLSDGHAWWDRPGQAPAQQAQSARDVRSTDPEAEDEPDVHRVGWWSRLLPRRKAEAPPVSMSIEASYVSHSTTERRYSIYSPSLQLIAETASSSTTSPPIAHEYIWFGGEPLAQIDTTTGEIAYYFNDHLGAPIVQTDDAGSVVWRAEREPYGERFATRVGLDRHQPLGLPGQEYDESAPDRQYNIFRWYRSSWGRYTQSDPMGLPAGVNLYAYVNGNPINSFDPWGLCDWQSRVKQFDQAYQQYLAGGSSAVYGEKSLGMWGPVDAACYIVTLGSRGSSCGGRAVAAYVALKPYNDDCCRVVVKDKWFLPHTWVELECKKCGDSWSKVKDYDPFWDVAYNKNSNPPYPDLGKDDKNRDRWGSGMGPK